MTFGARLRAFYELGKPNLSALVVVTGVIGLYLGTSTMDWVLFVHVVSGLFLTAAGACALNMVVEHDVDAQMHRTRTRPIPSGRVSRREALVFALVIFSLGFAQLAMFANLLTAGLALATLVIYVFGYTPLKHRGPIATWVGAIPGALPPVMGWTAARGRIDAPAVVLFGILFFWQLPHFLALAWIFRDDYQRAGYRLLPGRDGTIRIAGIQMTLCCLALIKVSLLLAPFGGAGPLYALGALGAGVVFLGFSIRVARRAGPSDARHLFLASIAYLPVLLGLIVVDRLAGGWPL